MNKIPSTLKRSREKLKSAGKISADFCFYFGKSGPEFEKTPPSLAALCRELCAMVPGYTGIKYGACGLAVRLREDSVQLGEMGAKDPRPVGIGAGVGVHLDIFSSSESKMNGKRIRTINAAISTTSRHCIWCQWW